MKRLEGKTAPATGHARRIRRTICEAFAREGAQVAVADRLGEDTEGTATAFQVFEMQRDLTETCAARASNVAQQLAAPKLFLDGGSWMN